MARGQSARLRDPARGLVRHQVEVSRVATDHGAQTDDGVVGARSREAPGYERDLERARHPRHVDPILRHAVLGQLPRRQAGALVARPRLVDPDMDRHTLVMRQIDRRGGGADIDGGEPAGIAMGEDVHALAGFGRECALRNERFGHGALQNCVHGCEQNEGLAGRFCETRQYGQAFG